MEVIAESAQAQPNMTVATLEAERQLTADAPSAVRTLAFVNVGSGSLKGRKVLFLLQRLLGKGYVFDLQNDKGAQRGLEMHICTMVEGEQLRVLACGGDGTFSWVAGSVAQLKFDNVILIPVALGSGNDMARALGWGSRYPGKKKLVAMLELIERADAESLDVWSYQMCDRVGEPATGSAPAQRYFCNYISLGVDAQVELHFNEARWENPERYNSRVANILWHAAYGVKLQFRQAQLNRVGSYIEAVYVDDQLISVPANAQALLLMNIPSYAAGATPWGKPRSTSEWRESMVDDSLIEVMALANLPHVVWIKTGGIARRLAQGHKICVKLRAGVGEIPIQADGEPWRQECGKMLQVELGRKLLTSRGPLHCARTSNHAKFTKA